MKVIFYRTWLISAGLALLAACSSTTPPTSETASGVTQLFTLEPTPDRNTLQKSATGYLASLLADPANQEITLVSLTPTLVDRQTQDLAVTLPDGKSAQFHLRDFNSITPGINGWVGYKPSTWKQTHAPLSSAEIDNDPLYYLSLAREGDTLVGNLLIDGQPYRIDLVGPGQHALIKIDVSKLPPEGEPIADPADSSKDSSTATAAVSAHSTIRVLFVTTNQSRAAHPNYKLRLAQALQDANQYLINSRVDLTYELAGFYDADYEETRDSHGQLADVRSAESTLGRAVYVERDALRADLVSMLSTFKDVCGRGVLKSEKESGYTVISCFYYNVLAHEMGHNLGANHNWEPGNSEGNPPYMFGYRQTGIAPKFHTQMSYACGSNCPQIPYHSNPRLTYQGLPLGTVEHHDVARRFNERRETVENFYPRPDRPKMIESSEQASCMQAEADGTVSLVPCDVDAENAEKRQWKLVPRGLRTLLVNVHAERIGAPKACLRTNILKAVSMQPCPAGATNDQGLYWTKLLMTGGDMIRTYWTNLDYCLLAAPDGTVRVDRCSSSDSAQRWKWAP